MLPWPKADHYSRRGKSLPQRESLEVEPAEEKPVKRATLMVEDLNEVERLEDLDTCMVSRGPCGYPPHPSPTHTVHTHTHTMQCPWLDFKVSLFEIRHFSELGESYWGPHARSHFWFQKTCVALICGQEEACTSQMEPLWMIQWAVAFLGVWWSYQFEFQCLGFCNDPICAVKLGKS